MIYMFKWLKWIWKGKPVIKYPGYHCGCCGKWVDWEFFIPTYKSMGEWWDTWGICSQCCLDGTPLRWLYTSRVEKCI